MNYYNLELNPIQDLNTPYILEYKNDFEAIFANSTINNYCQAIIPEIKDYLSNIEFLSNSKLVISINFESENITEVSNRIRMELNQVDLTESFGDLQKYLTLIGTELIQNSLMCFSKLKESQPSIKPDIKFELLDHGNEYYVKVSDNFGLLNKEEIVSKIKRAFIERTYEDKLGGAGLGLFMVINASEKVIFELCPSQSTTIWCIISKYRRLKDYKNKSHSIYFLDK